MAYKVRLTGRGEIVEYIENNDIYEFDAYLKRKVWELNLLCSKNGVDHELSDEESKIIVPRIVEYLEKLNFFFIFGGNYKVKTERVKPLTRDELIKREIESGNEVKENDDGSFIVIPKKRKSFLAWLFK
jgi:hypothetical protein